MTEAMLAGALIFIVGFILGMIFLVLVANARSNNDG